MFDACDKNVPTDKIAGVSRPAAGTFNLYNQIISNQLRYVKP
jgi:hypothetical protein